MHEVSVMSDVIKAVLDELSKHDVREVEEIVIVVGDLTNMGEEQLSFAFEAMSADTILSGSELVIEKEPIRIRCKECGFDGPAGILRNEGYDHSIPVLSCPNCDGQVTVVEGMSCRVRSIRIKEGGDVQT